MNIGSISGNQWLMQNSAYNQQASGSNGHHSASTKTAEMINSMGTVSSSTVNSMLMNANMNQANLNSSFNQLA